MFYRLKTHVEQERYNMCQYLTNSDDLKRIQQEHVPITLRSTKARYIFC